MKRIVIAIMIMLALAIVVLGLFVLLGFPLRDMIESPYLHMVQLELTEKDDDYNFTRGVYASVSLYVAVEGLDGYDDSIWSADLIHWMSTQSGIDTNPNNYRVQVDRTSTYSVSGLPIGMSSSRNNVSGTPSTVSSGRFTINASTRFRGRAIHTPTGDEVASWDGPSVSASASYTWRVGRTR